jgi:hypothetical protein
LIGQEGLAVQVHVDGSDLTGSNDDG